MTDLLLVLLILGAVLFPAGIAFLILELAWAREESA